MNHPMVVLLVPLGEMPAGGMPLPGYPAPPLHPSHELPSVPVHPGNELPPLPPDPARPSQPIHLPPQAGTLPIYPVAPGNDLPIPPGVIWPPLPPNSGSGKAVVLVAITGVGWRWTVVDLSLTAGYPLPGGPPPVAGTPLPPHAQPKK